MPWSTFYLSINVLLNRSWRSGEPQRTGWCQPLSQGKEGFSWDYLFYILPFSFQNIPPTPGLLLFFCQDFFSALGSLFSDKSSILWASLEAQRLECPPAMQETWVQSLGQENPLEKEMADFSSIPAWKIPWTEEPGGLQSMGSKRDAHD